MNCVYIGTLHLKTTTKTTAKTSTTKYRTLCMDTTLHLACLANSVTLML